MQYGLKNFVTLRSPEGDPNGGAGDGGAAAAAKAIADAATAKAAAEAKPDPINPDDHRRAIDDMHKYKKKAEALEEQQKADKLSKQKEQNQWKEIAEAKEKEAADAKAEKEKLQSSLVEDKKFSAVRAKCEALGLRAEAMDDLENLDMTAISVETTSTGKINVLGADKFAERLKTLKPHWFASKADPNVNGGSPRTTDSGGQITVAQIIAAEKEGRTSGDMSKYQDLHKKFQQQRVSAK